MKMALALNLALFFASATAAQTVHEIKMLNRGGEDGLQLMVFEPSYLYATKGDFIRIIPSDKAHSVESLKGGLPANIKPWKPGLNEEVMIELSEEGLYAFKCQPHYAMGMVGLVQVGHPHNLDQIKQIEMDGLSKINFEQLLQKVKKPTDP